MVCIIFCTSVFSGFGWLDPAPAPGRVGVAGTTLGRLRTNSYLTYSAGVDCKDRGKMPEKWLGNSGKMPV